MSRTEGQESKGVNAEIFRFEKGLAARYNVDPKANPENEVTNPRPDMLVAVRPSFKSPHWYRGRIVTVSKAHSHDTMVKVSTFNHGFLDACISINFDHFFRGYYDKHFDYSYKWFNKRAKGY